MRGFVMEGALLMAFTYSNGYIPLDRLITFKRGWNATDGHWHHSLSASTYRKHLALVARALARTGRTLAISSGWSAYRPYGAQLLARRIHGLGAAYPGTSSHGGFWEGQQTLAMDYGNWWWVYEKFGARARAEFYADCRAVGLAPGMIHPSRGNNYPDEPWHVIDLDPWAPVPAGTPAGIPTSTPAAPEEEEDEMITIVQRSNSGLAKGRLQQNGRIREITPAENALYRALERKGQAVYVTVSDKVYEYLRDGSKARV